MSKSPAFQFYPNDWFGSSKVRLMSPAERGCYIQLLATAWLEDDCGLPDDDAQLANLSGAGSQWEQYRRVVRLCFVARDGRLFNLRLLDERKKQSEWREKSKEGGIKSGQARRQRVEASKGGSDDKMKGGSFLVEPKPNSSVFSLQSSFSSSFTDLDQAKAVGLGNEFQEVLARCGGQAYVDRMMHFEVNPNRRAWWIKTYARCEAAGEQALAASWDALEAVERRDAWQKDKPRWVRSRIKAAGVQLPAWQESAA